MFITSLKTKLRYLDCRLTGALLVSGVAHIVIGGFMGPASGLPGGAAAIPQAHRLPLRATQFTVALPAAHRTLDGNSRLTLSTTLAPMSLAPLTDAGPALVPKSEARTEGVDDPMPLFAFSLPHYYSSNELTQRPQVVRDVPPILSREWSASEPKKAVLLLLINEIGGVDKIDIEKSALPPEFERLTLESFATARFTPGEIDGTPVKSRIRIEVLLDQAPLMVPGWGD